MKPRSNLRLALMLLVVGEYAFFNRAAAYRDCRLVLLFGTTESMQDELLKELRSEVGRNEVYWGGKDNNWLYLDCF